jgi:hypothetical protein
MVRYLSYYELLLEAQRSLRGFNRAQGSLSGFKRAQSSGSSTMVRYLSIFEPLSGAQRSSKFFLGTLRNPFDVYCFE